MQSASERPEDKEKSSNASFSPAENLSAIDWYVGFPVPLDMKVGLLHGTLYLAATRVSMVFGVKRPVVSSCECTSSSQFSTRMRMTGSRDGSFAVLLGSWAAAINVSMVRTCKWGTSMV